MHPHASDLILLSEPESLGEQQVMRWLDGVVAEGFLDATTLGRAKEEARAWYADPRAFSFRILVFAAGTAWVAARLSEQTDTGTLCKGSCVYYLHGQQRNIQGDSFL